MKSIHVELLPQTTKPCDSSTPETPHGLPPHLFLHLWLLHSAPMRKAGHRMLEAGHASSNSLKGQTSIDPLG